MLYKMVMLQLIPKNRFNAVRRNDWNGDNVCFFGVCLTFENDQKYCTSDSSESQKCSTRIYFARFAKSGTIKYDMTESERKQRVL